jgi:hypothetical protein
LGVASASLSLSSPFMTSSSSGSSSESGSKADSAPESDDSSDSLVSPVGSLSSSSVSFRLALVACFPWAFLSKYGDVLPLPPRRAVPDLDQWAWPRPLWTLSSWSLGALPRHPCPSSPSFLWSPHGPCAAAMSSRVRRQTCQCCCCNLTLLLFTTRRVVTSHRHCTANFPTVKRSSLDTHHHDVCRYLFPAPLTCHSAYHNFIMSSASRRKVRVMRMIGRADARCSSWARAVGCGAGAARRSF